MPIIGAKTPVWSVQVIKEDGSFDKENLRKFCEEKFYSNNDFFKLYIESPIPFAFLCRSAGSIVSAISRINSENKGFIRCNNGTLEQIDEQCVTALEAISLTPCRDVEGTTRVNAEAVFR